MDITEDLDFQKVIELLPKKNQRFRIEDFFQTEVDAFEHGDFLMKSIKKAVTRISPEMAKDIESIDTYHYVISTYCYTYKRHWKIIVCNLKSRPWHNSYHCRDATASANGGDGYCHAAPINDFIDWVIIEQKEAAK